MKTDDTEKKPAPKNKDPRESGSVNDRLRHHKGSEVRYPYWGNPRIVFTPGVKELAEMCDASWLIDTILMAMRLKEVAEAVEKSLGLGLLQIWKLELGPENSVMLSMQLDADGPAVWEYTIPEMDFPFASAEIWGFLSTDVPDVRWTLCLPSEYKL